MRIIESKKKPNREKFPRSKFMHLREREIYFPNLHRMKSITIKNRKQISFKIKLHCQRNRLRILNLGNTSLERMTQWNNQPTSFQKSKQDFLKVIGKKIFKIE
jgi:hypothetical protein